MSNGIVVRILHKNTNFNNSGSVAIPFANTKPRDTDGYQAFEQAIYTPVDPANSLIIDVGVNLSCSASNRQLTVALFLAGTPDALCVSSQFAPVAEQMHNIVLRHYIASAGPGSRTYRVRLGADAPVMVTMNGVNSVDVFNETMCSWITITEYI